MPLIAIVGAGPGMGEGIARTFAAQGFDVALISRTQAKVDAVAASMSG